MPPKVKLKVTSQTPAQRDWLKRNKGYARMSHVAHVVKFEKRGTLRADGTFIPEDKMPVTDGNGDFGVGVPAGGQRRSRR